MKRAGIIILWILAIHQVQAQNLKAWKIVIGGIQVAVPATVGDSAIPGKIKQLVETGHPAGSYLTSFVTTQFARMETGPDSATIQKQSKARGITPEYLKEVSILDKTAGKWLTFSTGDANHTAKLSSVSSVTSTSFFSQDAVTIINDRDMIPEFSSDTATICGFVCKKVTFRIAKLPDHEFIFWYTPQIPSYYNKDIAFIKQLPGALLALCNYSVKKRTMLVGIAKSVMQVPVTPGMFSAGPLYHIQL